MDLKPVKDLIIAGHPDYTFGSNLFISFMPAQIVKGVLLVVDDSGDGIDHEVTGNFRTRFQMINRSIDYTAGYSEARAISSTLTLERVTQGDHFYHFMRPRHLPMPYRAGASGQIEFSVNFDVFFAES